MSKAVLGVGFALIALIDAASATAQAVRTPKPQTAPTAGGGIAPPNAKTARPASH